MPDYCPDDALVVPITIKMKNYGKILSTYVLTLKEKETSDHLVHPVIPGINFTITLDELRETCS